ncbi:sodium- and chloride-dependent neutral and basic amino acid transporter B(0+)-like isoform X1 [Drosophila teissieri]|uniref:sodium- and chloride-dependent neutral and basic amino acid transporter B(0+)-like isoform X1 n=1 Tax=Drosophila teissieri TaxID=7243 RepID=UPI001CB9F0DB|nr:sodium- and chloride-dependent neutral and basic amino acid transporter B(0+)-like isoform X1 [Drosophila teissieri]
MLYETSYDTGLKPFSPDLKRGKWEKPTDYLFACFGLALKLDIFVASYWFFFDMGIFAMMPYLVYMVIYLVPIMVIHSFMGQFSSSGFISAFRLSPFFKGMGYVSVFLTIAMLVYYSIFAAVPLLFMINSFRPTLPWSCEGLKSWYNESAGKTTICNVTISEDFMSMSDNDTEFRRLLVHLPSVLYFQYHFETVEEDNFPDLSQEYELSWRFVGLFILVWAMVAFIFYKFSETAKFGKFLRYMVIVTLILLLLCFGRFLFLPGALLGLKNFMKPNLEEMLMGVSSTFIMVLHAFGAGWGSVIALSSFNEFKTDIMAYSWIISFGQIFIFIMFGMVSFMLDHYFNAYIEGSFDTQVLSHWVLFLSGATALSSLGWPNLWTFIYYTMLLMAALIVITTQIFTVLQSLFDEFEILRVRKQEVTFGLIGGIAVCSLFFCTNHGIIFFSALSLDVIFSHSLLHLLLLLVVLWIYGRERFQRDIEFMLGQPFASWKVFILRFIAPIILIICLLIGIFVCVMEHSYSSEIVLVMSIILVVIPILAIPGYGIYFLYLSTGTFWERFKRTCRPTDWYPVEMEHRQKYEESLNNSDMTQQLTIVPN